MKNLLRGALLVCTLLFNYNNLLADQTHPDLPGLFAKLRIAPDAQTAVLIESQIWKKWAEHPHEPTVIDEISQQLSANKPTQALYRLNSLVVDYPEFAEAWNRRASLHYLLGEYSKSLADLQQVLELEPRHFGAISGVALIMQAKGEKGLAYLALSKVLEISPQNVPANNYIKSLDMGSENSI